MTIAFLALGSNIEPEKNILEAVKLLSTYVKVLKSSTVYLTKPLRHKIQSYYYNCVIEIETCIEPHKLKLETLRVVEEKLGRKRTKDKYASRTIDIDLILYGDLSISDDILKIPDSSIVERPFVAIPLAEIDPKLLLPPSNRPITEIRGHYENVKLLKLKDFTESLHGLINQLGTD